MEINKDTMKQELTRLTERVFKLPEVNMVKIKDINIYSADETDKIAKSVEECYHDVLSDIDVGIHVTLHPKDIGDGHGYHSNPERIGLLRENYLGLACSEAGGLFQMFRVIMKNGIRFDIGMYITEDLNAPIYQIPCSEKEEIKEEGKFWPRWDLRKADSFWFVQIQALAKLMRRDYLIADHLANMQINETLLAQMLERDNQYGTNFHRYGYAEQLDYQTNIGQEFSFDKKEDTYNLIASKLCAAAVSYDRMITRLNPVYEERRSIFFNIWKQYDSKVK